MEQMTLDAESLFATAELIDFYCMKQTETINGYYTQIMALESEWKDDETFGGIVNEIIELRTKARLVLEEIQNKYPSYFRQKAKLILDRPTIKNNPAGTIPAVEVPRLNSNGVLRGESTEITTDQALFKPAACKATNAVLKAGVNFEDSGQSVFELSKRKKKQDKLPATKDADGTEKGKWLGEPGNSMFIPLDEKRKRILEYYKMEGVVYKNNKPDFSKANTSYLQEIKISDYKTKRYGNFSKADKELAKKMNISKAQATKYRRSERLTWHEIDAEGHMLLVPRELHDSFAHSGGISESKDRQAQRARNKIEQLKGLKLAKGKSLGGRMWKI